MLAVTMVGVLAGAATSIVGGVMAHDSAEYNAEMEENNAKIAQQNAQLAIDQGNEDERNQRLKTQQLIGQQRSAYGASGVVVDQGSAMQTVLDTTKMGEYDALTIRDNAKKQAWGYNTQASNFKSQAGIYQNSADNAWIGAVGGVGSSLLSGASSMIGGLPSGFMSGGGSSVAKAGSASTPMAGQSLMNTRNLA